jgi:hypothetical protein
MSTALQNRCFLVRLSGIFPELKQADKDRMRALLIFATVAAAVLAAAVISAQQPRFLVLSSWVSSACNGAQEPYNVTVPLGICLNNHDFDAVDCTLLTKCLTSSLPSRYGSKTFPYVALVNCSRAPAMSLSVLNSVSGNTLTAKIYPLQKTCGAIGLPLHYSYGECASTFALAKHCGIAGASLTWM